jgi:hypothetical protein
LALAVAGLARPVAKAVAGLAAAGMALLLVIRPQTPWTILRHTAMLQSASSWSGEVRYYGVGRSSTVLLFDQPSGYRLTTNGLPESIVLRDDVGYGDVEPACWLGLLPALLRPGLREMLVIGLGGGITVESVPSSVKEITVIELEDEVKGAHEWLANQLGDSPLRDPRVRLVLNDARGALQLTDARFGAIVSQPSHPWTAGASHLYTREFFSLVSRHLEPGGVFVQWIGLAFVDEALLRSMVATLLDVFPHVSIFEPTQGAVLFAASDAPIDPVATAGSALAAAPGDFARYGLKVPEDVALTWGLATSDARDFAGAASLLTDDENPLATRSSRIGRAALAFGNRAPLFSKYEPLAVAGDGLDPIYLVSRMAAQGSRERALQLARSLSDEQTRFTAQAWAKLYDAPGRAAASFRRVLKTWPGADVARYGLVRVIRPRVEAGDPDALELAAPLEGTAKAVVQGWRHAAQGEWEELRALDAMLAAADPLDLARLDALRLRIQWRYESSEPAHHEEGAAHAGELLQSARRTPDLVLAAQALAAADRANAALVLIDRVTRGRRSAEGQAAALAVLDAVRPDVDEAAWARTRRRLTAPSRRAQAME